MNPSNTQSILWEYQQARLLLVSEIEALESKMAPESTNTDEKMQEALSSIQRQLLTVQGNLVITLNRFAHASARQKKSKIIDDPSTHIAEQKMVDKDDPSHDDAIRELFCCESTIQAFHTELDKYKELYQKSNCHLDRLDELNDQGMDFVCVLFLLPI